MQHGQTENAIGSDTLCIIDTIVSGYLVQIDF